MLCGKCKCAIYCTKECQKRHWTSKYAGHKDTCRKCQPDDVSSFEGWDKNAIIELGNGMGGGQNVRIGYPLLTAYALALEVSRASFVQALRAAPGELSENWLDAMTESERAEIGCSAVSSSALGETGIGSKRKLDDGRNNEE